ncbi:MAG: ATP-dependent DNA helicase RecG [Rhodospirillales bacterium]
MRPEILFELFRELTALDGVGPRTERQFANLGLSRVVDLLWHLPTGIIDRRYRPTLGNAEPGRIATLTVTVEKHLKAPNKRAPYKIRCRDDNGRLILVFFHAREDYLRRMLPEGETRVVSGRLEQYGSELQMTHPDHVVTADEIGDLPNIEPVYPLTAGISLKQMTKAVRQALAHLPDLAEWHDGELVSRQGWPDWAWAVRAAHAPVDAAALDPSTPARARLAYDELLANQLALAVVRRSMRRIAGRGRRATGDISAPLAAALPYELTGSQKRALSEIGGDLASDQRMLRLLQGDVGSGKTVVAAMAMAQAIEAGSQAALMAPTEILARQHFATLTALFEPVGILPLLLTGREKGRNRTAVLDTLKSGGARVVVGTHALFQDDVAFHDLGLVVVDEQHRFGVHQRLSLAAKGAATDVLVMTATPIPRTLVLTAYGDMDVSRLDEKPPGRKPIDTRAIPLDRLDEVVDGVRRAVEAGGRAYWVCPLVEESEKLDAAAAEQRYEILRKTFADRAGLVHGRMKAKDKDAAMAAFASGDIDILVATTVIEVGVDVPEANVMVIEHAERFGLAQLHQLRGRIGRGQAQSTCLLLYAPDASETARARIKVMRESEDGFLIAEEDLRLRGAGELLGTRQSGLPTFRLADLAVHADLLATARKDVQLTLERDPDLSGHRGQALRALLYLFERDAAIKNLRSG